LKHIILDISCCHYLSARLFRRNFDGPIVDLICYSTGILTVHSATNREASSEDLLYGTTELAGTRLLFHCTSDVIHLLQSQVATVGDVLDLLPVSNRLLEGLNDKGGGRGNNRDLGLTVLDGKLAGDFESLPVLRGLCDVIANLLGGL